MQPSLRTVWRPPTRLALTTSYLTAALFTGCEATAAEPWRCGCADGRRDYGRSEAAWQGTLNTQLGLRALAIPTISAVDTPVSNAWTASKVLRCPSCRSPVRRYDGRHERRR